MAFFTKEVNPRLAKRPLVFNGRLANRGLTSLVEEAVKFTSYFQLFEYEVYLAAIKYQILILFKYCR